MVDKAEYKLNIPIGGIKNSSIPLLGKAEKTSVEGIFAVREQAVVGKLYIVFCPVCSKPIFINASDPKVFRVMHKTCNMPIIVKGVAASQILNQGNAETNNIDLAEYSEENSKAILTDKYVVLGSKTNAMLSWLSFTGRKQYVLRIGKNYVGRKDENNPSDLSIKDEYASARSICIDVNKSARGFSFHMTVERATNPVLVNGKDQAEGSGFDLNYGDIIKLGKTTFTFAPVKK